mmetsp:Transcript_9834/g.17675  ORF Transcript_9834/g.17675 Transcript_9834/m.17675 type:complete len:263 (-) Transcript_9834:2998-3786(-)
MARSFSSSWARRDATLWRSFSKSCRASTSRRRLQVSSSDSRRKSLSRSSRVPLTSSFNSLTMLGAWSPSESITFSGLGLLRSSAWRLASCRRVSISFCSFCRSCSECSSADCAMSSCFRCFASTAPSIGRLLAAGAAPVDLPRRCPGSDADEVPGRLNGGRPSRASPLPAAMNSRLAFVGEDFDVDFVMEASSAPCRRCKSSSLAKRPRLSMPKAAAICVKSSASSPSRCREAATWKASKSTLPCNPGSRSDSSATMLSPRL